MSVRGVEPVDRLTLGFAVLLSLHILRHATPAVPWVWLLVGVALVGVLLALLPLADPDTPLMRCLGPGYPMLLMIAFYTALGMIAETGPTYDRLVQRWETTLFGREISVTWHQTFPWAPASWVFHLCYGAFYLLLGVVVLSAWRRLDRAAYSRIVFHIALAFYGCYVAFALFPVAGPRYMFGPATGPAADVAPARAVHALLQAGSAYGTAFPSSHVAASWMAVLAAWRDARGIALVAAPVAVCLALGAVYGQFHYGVDALSGALVSLILFAVADPLYRRLAVRRRA